MEFHHPIQQHPTPEDYFRKLKTPHEVINSAASAEPESEIEVLENILDKAYNDKEATLKEQVLE
jgi:hypothetical protein